MTNTVLDKRGSADVEQAWRYAGTGENTCGDSATIPKRRRGRWPCSRRMARPVAASTCSGAGVMGGQRGAGVVQAQGMFRRR